MTKLKVAVLEDDRELLEDLIESVKESGLAEVIIKSMNSDDFIAKVRAATQVDLLMLDIELSEESRTGIDVAHKLKLPVLFVSGRTRENLDGIEELNMDLNLPVEHVMKPITATKLKRILPKIAEEIRLRQKSTQIRLRLARGKTKELVDLSSIVFFQAGDIIEDNQAFERNGEAKLPTLSDKSTSGNKVMFFMHRKPEMLVDQTFEDLERNGLSNNQFIVISKSCRVNVDHILAYDRSNHQIVVRAMNLSGVTEEKSLTVSETYRSSLRKKF